MTLRSDNANDEPAASAENRSADNFADEAAAIGSSSQPLDSPDKDELRVPSLPHPAPLHCNASQQGMLRTPHGGMPRRWLFDRCDGISKPDLSKRPPTRICLPPPIIKLAPDIFEQNCLCERIGRIGLRVFKAENETARRRLLWVCFWTNVVGLLFMILACLAISRSNFGLVWNFAFTEVSLELISGPENYEAPQLFGVGLRAAAYQSYTEAQAIIPFDHFCELGGIRPETSPEEGATVQIFVDAVAESTGNCGSCQEMSQKIVPSLFLSMLGYIPNFSGDILRMYSNYDVNFAKCTASIFSWLTLATALYTWANYHKNCFSYITKDPVAIDENFEPTDPEGSDAYIVVVFNYRPGFGEWCLAIATLLKLVDIFCNLAMPTPSITRSYRQQAEYEWMYGADGDDGDEDEGNTGDVEEPGN